MSLSTRTGGVMVFVLLAALVGAGAFLGSAVASNLTEPGERVVVLENPQGFAQTPAWAKRSAGGFTGFGGLPALPGVVLHSGTISEINDGGRQAVAGDFTLLLDGQPVVQGEANTVSAGAHTLGEQPLAGYVLSAVFCVDGQGARVRMNGDTVVVALGQTVSCTLTNDDIPASITLVTVVVSGGAGRARARDFTLLFDDQPVVQGAANAVSAGAHTVGEQPLVGYVLSAVSCLDGQGTTVPVNGDTVVLALGQRVICTLTNDDVTPSVTLVKAVVNDDGGAAAAGDFTLLLDGRPVEQGEANAVSAGAHTVGEQPFDDYVLSSISCVDGQGTTVPVNLDTVVLALGQSVTCTLTNNDVAPSVTLVKTVVNDDGGRAAAGDFTLLLDGQPVVQGEANAVSAGAHTVGEQPFDGYVLSTVFCVDGQDTVLPVNGDTVVLALGQSVICTLTNDDVDAGLTLQTVVVNDDGGQAQSADFALRLDGRRMASGMGQAVSTGAHTVGGQPAGGYVMTAVSCVDGQGTTVPVNGDTVDVALGQSVTCTFTNDDVAPSVTLLKAVVNDAGGEAQPGDFRLLLDGGVVEQGEANAVSVGAHTVGEQPLEGYLPSTVSCVDGQGRTVPVTGDEVVLALDQHVTCTLTSDDVDALLTLRSVVVNDDGGRAQSGSFTLLLDEQRVASGVGQAVSAGEHTVGEQPFEGYLLSDVSCVDDGDATVPVNDGTVVLALNQHVTCTFISDDMAPSITLTTAVVGSLTVDAPNARTTVDFTEPLRLFRIRRAESPLVPGDVVLVRTADGATTGVLRLLIQD